MDLGLSEKVALVCGGSRGIGNACALTLSEEGAKIIILARELNDLKKTCQQIDKKGGNAEFIQADLGQIDQIKGIAEKARKIYGKIDILINNAGGPPSGEPLSFSSLDWENAFRQNFLSAVELTRWILPGMVEREWGRIINITSITVKTPLGNLVLSNGIRMAVVGWGKTLAGKYAKHGITVNNVAPGFTLTDRLRQLLKKEALDKGITEKEVLASYSEKIPAGRLATPREIASAVVFLASEAASYINGVTLTVDGGFVPCL